MTREKISEALNGMDVAYVEEALYDTPIKRVKTSRFRFAAALAAVFVAMFSVTGMAMGWFSGFAGDDLRLESVYKGEGMVELTAENRSDKDLRLQDSARLVYYTDHSPVPGDVTQVTLSPREVPAGETVTLTVDLSGGYDAAELEQPLSNDFYVLEVTNDAFLSGQKWSCLVHFRNAGDTVKDTWKDTETSPDSRVLPELQSYFETFTADIFARWNDAFQYMETVENALQDQAVATPVSPWPLPMVGVTPDTDSPWLTVDLKDLEADSVPGALDGYNKLLGRTRDEMLNVIHVYVPTARDGVEQGSYSLPLLYLAAYDTADVRAGEKMAFIRGNLLTFAEMEAYRVYQDEGITIYEVHSLVYDDLAAYVNDHSSIRTDMVLDEETMAAIQNTYDLLTADGAFDSRIRYADR